MNTYDFSIILGQLAGSNLVVIMKTNQEKIDALYDGFCDGFDQTLEECGYSFEESADNDNGEDKVA